MLKKNLESEFYAKKQDFIPIEFFSNMQEDLNKNPQQLIINLLLMGVQFLESFEKWVK